MKNMMKFCLVLAIFAFVFTGCNTFSLGSSLYYYENAAAYTEGAASVNDEIDEIEINWSSGKVNVRYYDGTGIKISESYKEELDEETSLYYRVIGKTLKIQYAKSGYHSAWEFDKELTVLIPQNEEKEYALSLNVVSADVKIEDLRVSEFSLDSVSGKTNASFSNAVEALSLETVSGAVAICVPAVGECEIESVSAGVELVITKADVEGQAIERLDAESVSGNIMLELPEDTSFTLAFDSISGDIESDFSFKKRGNRYTVGDGTADFDVQTVSGDIGIYIVK